VRILLVTHADLAKDPNHYVSRFVAGLTELADVVIACWEDMASPSFLDASRAAGASPSGFDVCLLFVRFRLLAEATPFDWSGFGGRRVWLEHDAWNNYSPAHARWHGRYPAVYERDRFHLMISTGRQTTQLLRRDGVNAQWVPKGYSDDVFHDLGLERSGTCTFGTMWPSRRALIHHLRGRGIEVIDVSGPFGSLNERLNAHVAGVVCNMPGLAPFGRAGRAINRLIPSFVRTWPAVEPMIKTFETAAAGCAPIVDHLEELEDLGFVNGATCLTYRTFDEASEVLLSADPAELRAIGTAAAALARTRHTWRHRAVDVLGLLEGM